MAKSLDSVMDDLSEERRQRVHARGDELVEIELTLQALRKKLGLTQEHLADLLHTRQGSVSKVEQRSDMLISTLRAHVEAMGGTLELIAKIPGQPPIKLEGLQDLSI